MGFNPFKAAKKAVKKVSKVFSSAIPKQLRPFAPYIAAAMVGPGAAGSGIFGNLATRQFMAAAATKGLTDDEADFKDILRTGAFAAAPSAIGQGLGKFATTGTSEALKFGDKGFFTQQAKQLAAKGAGSKYLNPEGISGLGNNLKMIGVQGSVDAAAQLAELNQEEIDKYNDSLGGNLDSGERRAQLTAIFSRAGYEPEYIDTMLTTYGYAQGGIASLRSGYEEGGTVTISKKEYERLKGDKEIAQGIDFASTGLGMLGKSGHSMEPVGMLKFARGGEVIEEQEDLSIEGQTAGLLRNMIREHGYEGATTMWNNYKDMRRQGEINMGFEEFINQYGDMFGGAQGGLAMARGGEVIEESETLMAGGPYGSGRDTQDAMNVWQGMGPEDKSLFEGFIDFYKNGSWRDQIMGQADVEENTMMASAPSLEDSLNEKSLMMFRKPYYELTEEEVELLNEMATGGRVGFTKGGDVMRGVNRGIDPLESLDILREFKRIKEKHDLEMSFDDYLDGEMFAKGGRVNYASGGIMNRNLLNTGVDKDMRTGGFIPEGTREKADDVPARLSKNEFVMTADAVKAAGGGSVNRGAQRMYNLMNNLEAKV
jgi:hypothetical protein